jgi:SIR2-like protein
MRPTGSILALLTAKRGGKVAVGVDASNVVEQIADVLRNGQCILFLGAAVHAPPPESGPYVYPEALRPPLGASLSRTLAEACELGKQFPDEDPTNLQRVALFFEIERSRHQLVEAIRTAVQVGKGPSPVVRALAEFDFPRIITTNYDQLFEDALRAAGKHPRVSVYTPKLEPTSDPSNPTADSPIVYKIHGDIEQPETVVVTDEDYIQFLLRMSNKEPYDPIPLKLKADLTERTTLFVGYSLLDYNLRLLFKALRWGNDPATTPDMYSVDRSPDPLIFDVWQDQRRYVKFIVQDVWAFVPQLYELVMGKEMPDYRA